MDSQRRGGKSSVPVRARVYTCARAHTHTPQGFVNLKIMNTQMVTKEWQNVELVAYGELKEQSLFPVRRLFLI